MRGLQDAWSGQAPVGVGGGAVCWGVPPRARAGGTGTPAQPPCEGTLSLCFDTASSLTAPFCAVAATWRAAAHGAAACRASRECDKGRAGAAPARPGHAAQHPGKGPTDLQTQRAHCPCVRTIPRRPPPGCSPAADGDLPSVASAQWWSCLPCPAARAARAAMKNHCDKGACHTRRFSSDPGSCTLQVASLPSPARAAIDPNRSTGGWRCRVACMLARSLCGVRYCPQPASSGC